MAGRRRRGEQTSVFNMPGAGQACSSPCIAREMGRVLCSCPSVGTSATLCPQSTWASWQCIAHCHALAGKMPKAVASSPQKQRYRGTVSTMLGETSTFQPQAPLMGASSFSLHPHVHPSGLSAEWLEWSCLSTVHHIRQCIRTPRCLHPLLSLCSHSEASCKLLTSYSGKHGATDGLEVQSSLSSLLVEGGQPVYFDSDSSLLGGWLQKHQHTAGQIKDGFSVTLVWTFLATTV